MITVIVGLLFMGGIVIIAFSIVIVIGHMTGQIDTLQRKKPLLLSAAWLITIAFILQVSYIIGSVFLLILNG